ncbi:hypothetical protein Fmac_009607 [Flemingia macrophylla]|uniref:Uncharacterized protein n=1 Tax=Flemingia macrophylla TaxID=520843 RepID=A0ABD1N0R3_9FABA
MASNCATPCPPSTSTSPSTASSPPAPSPPLSATALPPLPALEAQSSIVSRRRSHRPVSTSNNRPRPTSDRSVQRFSEIVRSPSYMASELLMRNFRETATEVKGWQS